MTTVGYIRYPHTIEVHSKKTLTSAAGQKTAVFTFDSKIPAIANSPEDQFTAGERVRTVPYQDFIQVLELIVPGSYDKKILYTSRILNIRDRYGNILEAGPFQIISIQPKFGWNGKKHHLHLDVRYVVED